MSSIGKLRDLANNTVLSQGIEIIGNFYSVLTAANGYIGLRDSIKGVEDKMLSYGNNTNHPEYKSLKIQHDGLIKEQALHMGVLITSFKDLANSVLHYKDNTNFENLGTAGARLIANSTILIERLTREKVGENGKQIDLSLGVAVMADAANVIGSLGETYDDLINKKTAGLGKVIPKPWLVVTKGLDGVGDSLTTIANNLVDAQGNSKIVYYLGIEDLLPEEPELYKELHDKNSMAVFELAYAFRKGGFIQHAVQNIEDNMEKMFVELIESWKQLISFIDDDQGVIYYGKEGNDTFFGTNDNDYLNGKGGHDTLDGEKGNDALVGGQGYDTYHIKDHDTIYDKDGKGQILFDGKQLPKDFIRHLTTNIWYAKDSKGEILYSAIKEDNDLVIASYISPLDGVVIKDFFTTATTSGTTYSALSIVLGDSQEDIDKEGIYTLKTNDKFHSNVYANAFPSNNIQIIGSDKIDWVMANSSNKTFDIDVEGGNDHVFGSDMNDIIKGGAGNDLIYGSSGFYDFADENNPKLPKPQKEGEGADEDTLIGGLGNDLISGSFGNDTIWAEDEYKGNSKTPLHEDQNNPYNKNNPDHQAKGDWIVGGRGNDFIHGSTSNDFLQGGADGDHIYGGGGQDVILGDGHIRFGNKTQTIQANTNINHNPTLIGADIHPLVPGVIGTMPTIHRGATLSIDYNYDNKNNEESNTEQQFFNQRDNRVFSWNIEIDAKQGDYKLTKQKDIPLADDYHILEDKFHKNTNDFLYGGAGDDLIIGQYGHDYLDGGEGDDILWGDDNRDKDNSKIAGNDTLKGGKGKDTLIGGHGHDRYVFDLADLEKGGYNKTIKDADNQGRIVIDGRDLTGLEFVKIDDVSKVYKTLDDKFELIGNGNGNYTLSGQDFNGVIYIKDTPITDGTILGMVLSAEIKNTAPFSPYGLPNKVILAGEDININLSNTFVDAEDSEDKLTYSMTGLGATGLGFDPNTKLLTGTAPDSGIFI